MSRRQTFGVAAALLGTALALGAVELGVRQTNPTLPTQVVGPRYGVEVVDIDGVPVWRATQGSAERENLDCEGKPSVAAFGSSILYGSGMAPEQSWSELMQAAHPEWCVHNLSQNAFSFDAKEALARRFVPERRPELVLWEVWATDVDRYTRIGDDAWRLEGYHLDDQGRPDAFGLPGNAWLFEHSRAWQWLTLSRAPRADPPPGSPWPAIGERIVELAGLVSAHGGELVAVFCPVLDRPLPLSVQQRTDMERELLPMLEQAGVGSLRLAELLQDQQVEEIRLDRCCHYDERGNRVLAERLAPLVEARLSEAGAPDPAPGPPAPPPTPR